MNPALFKHLVATAGRRPRRLPRQLHPVGLARDYAAKITRGPLRMALDLLRERVLPLLPKAAANASKVAITDSADIGVQIDAIQAQVHASWTRARIATMAAKAGNRVSDFQKAQLNKQLRALVNVDVIGAEPWLAESVAEFATENVALIRSVNSDFLGQVEKQLTQGIADGLRHEELATIIEDRYGVAASRAKLIARDQTGKFYGDLNRVRQQNLGITSFIWRTVEDERVRPEHAALDGQEFKWGEAPFGGPGEDILCRCFAEPILPDVAE